MGDIKFYSPVDFDDTSSGVTIEGDLIANANVGIGTTSPHFYNNYRHVTIDGTSGAGFMLRNGGSNKYEQYVDSGGAIFYLVDNDPLKFFTNSTERLRVTGAGNVGIGTTSPGQKLTVDGDVGITTSNQLFVNDIAAYTGAMTIGPTGASELKFRTSGSEKMRIASGGNVGIGTTSPSQKLHVSGSARITGAIYDSNNSPGTSGQVLSSTASGTDWIDQGDVVVGSADKALSVTLTVKNTEAVALTKGQVVCAAPSASPPSGNLIEVKLADNNGTDSMPAIGVLNEGLDAAGGTNDEGEAIMFGKVSGIDTSAFDVGDEVFVSDTAGGLTKTKPTGVKYIQKIGVVIRDDANNGTIEVFGAGRTNDVPTPLYIDHANQRLGIGTTSPGEKLHIEASDPRIKIVDTDGTNWESEVFTQGGALKLQARNGTNFGNISFQGDNGTTQSEYARFNSSGNFGIGTTSPNAQLQIDTPSANQPGQGLRLNRPSAGTNYHAVEFATNGTVDWSIGQNSNDAFEVYENASAATTRFTIKEGGNVGIGTTSPSEKLHITDSQGHTQKIQFGLDSIYNYIGVTAYDTLELSVDENNANGNSAIAFRLDGSERIRINTSGNVGIGTTSPGEKLDVYGNVRINTGSELRFNNANVGAYRDSNDLRLAGYNSIQFLSSTTSMSSQTERMRITNAGNVGIGTTTPGEKLVVQDGKVLAGHTNTKGYGFHDLSNYAYTANTGRLSLVSNGIEAVSIDSSQRVGVGTTRP